MFFSTFSLFSYLSIFSEEGSHDGSVYSGLYLVDFQGPSRIFIGNPTTSDPVTDYISVTMAPGSIWAAWDGL